MNSSACALVLRGEKEYGGLRSSVFVAVSTRMVCEEEYELLEQIGRGSYGKVYRAQHESGEVHAIKVGRQVAHKLCSPEYEERDGELGTHLVSPINLVSTPPKMRTTSSNVSVLPRIDNGVRPERARVIRRQVCGQGRRRKPSTGCLFFKTSPPCVCSVGPQTNRLWRYLTRTGDHSSVK